MSTNSVVRARIDEHIGEEASVVLAAIGLKVSQHKMMCFCMIHQQAEDLFKCLNFTMRLNV